MGLISYKLGQTSIILRVKILDSSVSTGAGLTGLAYNSSGLVISTIADNESSPTYYRVADGNVEDVAALGAYAAPSANKCRFKQVSAGYHPGVYEIQLANARYAVSNAKSLLVSIGGATNAAETDVVIPLTSVDPYDGVRSGMTALPNAAAGAAGGLPRLDGSSHLLVYSVDQGVTLAADQAVNVTKWGGTAVASAYVQADAAKIGGQTATAAGAITVNANLGTTQPINFTGAGASALAKINVIWWGGNPLTSAYVNVNAEKIGGQLVTAAGAITVGAYVGNAGAALAVNASGRVDLGSIYGRAVSDPGGAVTVGLYVGTGYPIPFTAGSGNVKVDVDQINGDYVAGPDQTIVFPAAIASAANQTSILNAVNAITANTARSQPVVPFWFVRPASGSTAYEVALYLYDLQGHLEAPDAAPVVHARTAAGASRDDHLDGTTMTLVGTGHYKATYTVQSTDAAEAVYFDFTWAVNTVAMADAGVAQVQDAEATSLTAAIKTQTDKLAYVSDGEGGYYVKSSPQTDVKATDTDGNALATDSQVSALLGAVGTLTPAERNAIADALLDRTGGIETHMTPRRAMRIMAAVLAGKVSGAGSGTESFTGIDGATPRVVVTTDDAGNRTNATYTP